ncbi:MAG: hypothetical protein AMXMBFR13_33790 [Phycisphaerae bacterium]
MDEELVREGPARDEAASPGTPPAPHAKSRRGSRLKWWQKLALVGFSLGLLLVAELAVRLFGYGPDLSFVVTRLDRGSERIMGINPEAYKRFHGALGLDPARTRFAPWREFIDPKPANTFRVMFMGGSSVEGYPHAPNGCAPAFLEAMLQDAWPDKHVEVINCGVTAINSWSLRAWAPELLRHQPDLLVIYAGHNEFYGGFGPASLNGAGTSRSRVLAHIWMRDLRLVGALSDLIGLVGLRRQPPQGLLMERLARERQIPLNSEIYAGCRDNFRANLEDMARAARAASVPVALCGLVSNEKGLVPMNSVHREELSADQLKLWEDHFNAGREAGQAFDWAKALQAFHEAAQIDEAHAELIYRSAVAHENLGAYDQARRAYRRARDLDALRFRATAEFSDVIREVAERENALHVDVLPAFEAASPKGLIGWNLMTDHLHPTVEGHYLLARTICERLAREKNGAWPSLDLSRLPAYATVADRLGNDELTAMMAKVTVYTLTKGFPYAGTPNEELHRRLEQEILDWQNGLTGPLAVAHEKWSSNPGWDRLHYHVGQAYFDLGEYGQAITYFRRADQMSEPHSVAAGRARCGLVRARLLSAVDPEAIRVARAQASDLQVWLGEALAMHPDQQAVFKRLQGELAQAVEQIGD